MQASMKIKFLVVGGGIAGMACAYALRRSGHEVHVVEEAKGLAQVRLSDWREDGVENASPLIHDYCGL